MGSGGPGLGRNPSKGENLRGLQKETKAQSEPPGPAGSELTKSYGQGPPNLRPPVTKAPCTATHPPLQPGT